MRVRMKMRIKIKIRRMSIGAHNCLFSNHEGLGTRY